MLSFEVSRERKAELEVCGHCMTESASSYQFALHYSYLLCAHTDFKILFFSEDTHRAMTESVALPYALLMGHSEDTFAVQPRTPVQAYYLSSSADP